ncbi:MAG: penicillin acylase family protein [Brevibacterium yomogidense]
MAQRGTSQDESITDSQATRDTAKPTRSRIRTILLSILAGLLVLVLLVTAFLTWSVMRAFPQTDGEIEVAGLQSEVTVQRDGHGIPTLTAETTDDLFRAQGFVHAQDRFWEMDFRRHMTGGRLSELFGEAQVGTDSFLRTLGWHRIAEEEVAALPPDALSYYEAYADGVNAYLEERQGGALALEYTVLGLQNSDYEPEPWTPTDSVAWLKAMAWDLRTNIEDETNRAILGQGLAPERLDDLYPDYPFDEHPVIMAEDPDGSDVVDAGIPAPATADDAEAAGGPAAASTDEPDADAEATPDAAEAAPGSAGALGSLNFDTSALSDLLERVDTLVGGKTEGIGSNSWVVSGEHTDTGDPLLANDPHLGAALPSVWSQMQLRCAEVTDECPFDVAGYSFSGLPGIVIGHNQQVAWGFTNLTTDVADLYVERVIGEGHLRDGETIPFETRQETIEVAGGEDVALEVRSTAHGPVVSGLTPEFTAVADFPRVGATRGAEERPLDPASGTDPIPNGEPTDDPSLSADDYALSLRWTALNAGTTAQAIFSLNLAEDFSDFRHAASQFDVPAQNLIYADTDGNIGYQAPGRLPIRGEGDGWLPQPGWDSAFDWQGFIPFEEQPVVYNPDSGYIVTANNAIVDDDYEYFLSRDWDYGYRGARIVELLENAIEAGPVTAADMADIQMDNEFPAADTLQDLYAEVSVEDEDVREALGLLANWDGQSTADSAAAAYANVLWDHVTAGMVNTHGATADTDAESGEPPAGADESPARTTIPRDDQSRFAVFLAEQAADADSPWWGGGRDELLQQAAVDAHTELVDLQGSDPDDWNWGELHALPLTHQSFGTSGIAPVEVLFNRGPYETGGGSGVVNATGWDLDDGFATTTVPSFRMVLDVGDWDASTWQNLTGQSGHAFHEHYRDQAEDWASGTQNAWGFSPEAVDAAAEDTLTLTP